MTPTINIWRGDENIPYTVYRAAPAMLRVTNPPRVQNPIIARPIIANPAPVRRVTPTPPIRRYLPGTQPHPVVTATGSPIPQPSTRPAPVPGALTAAQTAATESSQEAVATAPDTPSWFTDPAQEIISGIPNWGLVAAGAGALFLFSGKKRR
jgi:hypothetical protein